MFRPSGVTITFFCAALEIKISLRVAFAQIAGVKPAVASSTDATPDSFQYPAATFSPRTRISPVARELYFEARQSLADRALPEPEGMIHADERSGFREPVALNRGVAEPSQNCSAAAGSAAPPKRSPRISSRSGGESRGSATSAEKMLAIRRAQNRGVNFSSWPRASRSRSIWSCSDSTRRGT